MIAIRLAFPILLCIQINRCYAGYIAQHQCRPEGGGIKAVFKVLPNDGQIHSVYGYDATTGTLDIHNGRVDACYGDGTGITSPTTEAVTIEAVVDTVAGTVECGASTRTETIDGVDVIFYSFFFHVFADSASTISVDDKNYQFTCRSDDLSAEFVSTNGFDIGSGSIIFVPRQQYGASLLVLDENDNPKDTAVVGDKTKLAAKFHPGLDKGPDNYGTLFYIGFLANDPTSGAESSPYLSILIYPKYPVRTDIRVTYGDTKETVTATDGEPTSVVIPVDLMGCSEDGVAELESKGVEIFSFDMEVGVIVLNREANSEGHYNPLPVDVIGDAYTVMSLTNTADTYEFMIIATEDTTSVQIALTASLTYDSVSYSAGDTLTVSLDRMETFHASLATNFPPMVVTSDKNVAVIVGNRVLNSKHVVAQLPPNNRVGKKYVLPLVTDTSTTTGLTTEYTIQTVTTETTTIKQFTGSDDTAFTEHVISVGGKLKLTIDESNQCEIEADHPVLVMMMYTNSDSSTSALVVVPPISHFKRSYDLSSDFDSSPGPNMLVTYVYKTSTDLQVEFPGIPSTGIILAGTAIKGPSGYLASPANTYPISSSPKVYTLSSRDGFSTFLPIVLTQIGGVVKSAHLGLGVLYHILGYCKTSAAIAGDLVDNDCDGLVDEDLGWDGIDNDGDGRIDEDPPAGSNEYTGAVAIRPYSCKVSADPTFTPGALTYDLTDANGCFVTTAPFKLEGGFTVQSGTNIGGSLEMKVLYSGLFTIAMFVGYPKLYFRCETAVCYSAADTSCTSDICKPIRQKRQANTTPVRNISSDVWVYPVRPDSTDSANIAVVSRNTTLDDCLENTTILVSGSMLLGVALISMGTVCCMCMMFRKRWNHKKKSTKPSHYSSSRPNFTRKSHSHRY